MVRNIAKIWKLTVARIFLSASHITGFHRRHLSALSAIRWVSGVRLAAGRPLVGPSDNCEREAAVSARRDYQPAAHVGASVCAWHAGQSATRRSRSKSEPPWARLTTWWTLEDAPAGRRPRSASGRAERPPGFRLCMWFPRGLTRVKS